MKKKTFIVLVSLAFIYLVSILILKLNSNFMFVSIKDLNFGQYFFFILSQICIGIILGYLAYIVMKLRNHKVYQYTIPILAGVVYISGGLMLFGSILKEASINSMITPQATLDTIKLGNDLMGYGIGIFIIAFMYLGVFLGAFESLVEKWNKKSVLLILFFIIKNNKLYDKIRVSKSLWG